MKLLKINSGFCILLGVIIIVIVYYINKKEGFTASNCISKNKKKLCLKYECSSRPPGKKWKKCGTKWCTKKRLFYNSDRRKRQEECESAEEEEEEEEEEAATSAARHRRNRREEEEEAATSAARHRRNRREELECDSGYYLKDNDCVAYGCDLGKNDKCHSCVVQKDRISNADCNTCNAGYYLIDKKCNPFINLPITVYIVKNMDIEWPAAPPGMRRDDSITLTNKITKEQVTKMVNDVNNKFFNKHSIHLVLTIKEYNYSGNEQVLKDLSLLSRSDEDATLFERDYISKHKKKRRKLYQDLVHEHSKNSINIYMVTFSGNTRQGYADVNSGGALGKCEYTINGTIQKERYPMIVIGTWSNKDIDAYKYGEDEYPVDRSTFIKHTDGTPSLSFTFAHEITHILGLNHLYSSGNNIMNAPTSSFIITDQQKQTIIERSKYYQDHFSKCSRHENEDFLLRGVTRNGKVRTKIM